jgi:hypothetical protein
MNLRTWVLVGYSLIFFLGGYWIFQSTSVYQFALVLVGYIGLACGCLWWWIAHAADEDGDEAARGRPTRAGTGEIHNHRSKPDRSMTIRQMTWPSKS